MLLRTLHRLEASYIDGVYHAIPLIVSHPGELTEEDHIAAAFGSPSVSKAFWQRRRVLIEEVDEKDEEELIKPHPKCQGSQAVAESSVAESVAGVPLAG